MRLLQLELTNVNSLYGHWRIDFTDMAYQRNPLFAIIGPTGSGKSSLLDAISLALYGNTPRMNALPRGGDQDQQCPVMSKGTTLVCAAVRFQVDGITYMSSWQRRITARAKRLSDVEVELVRYPDEVSDKGEVLTTQLSDWRARMVEITHMTFETFLRSVLLSQGAFADFLKAKDDDRANILEQITGTAIYSDVGRWIFLRTKEELQKKELLTREAESLQLLTEDAKSQLLATISELKEKISAIKATQKVTEMAFQWRQRVEALSKEEANAELLYSEAERRYQALEEDLKKARAAQEALVPGLAAKKVKEYASQALRVQEEVARLGKALPEIESQLSAQKTLCAKGEEALSEAQKALTSFEPLYTQVRALDEALKTRLATLTLQRAQLQKLRERDVAEKAALTALLEKSETFRTTQTTLQARFAELEGGHDERVTPTLLKNYWEAWREAETAYARLTEKTAKLEALRTELKAKVSSAESALTLAKEAFEKARAEEAATRERWEVMSASETVRGKLTELSEILYREANVRLVTRTDRAQKVLSTLLGGDLFAKDALDSLEGIMLEGLSAEELSKARAPEALAQLSTLKASILEWRGEGEALKKTLSALTKTLEEKRTALEEAGKAHQTARLSLEKAESEAQLYAEELTPLAEHLKSAKEKTLNALHLTEEVATSEAAQEKVALYEQKWTLYQETQKTLKETTEALARFTVQIEAKKESLLALAKDERTALEVVQTEETALKAQQEERQALFGEKDPEAEQKRLREGVATADQVLRTAEKLYQEVLQQKNQCVTAKTQQAEQLLRHKEWTKKAKDELDEEMQKVCITSYKELQARFMPEEQMRETLARGQSAETARQEAKTRLTLLTQQAEDLREQAVTEKALAELAAEKDAQEAELLEKTRELANQEGVIARDKALSEKHKELEAQIRHQEEVYRDWYGLNNLVGSADGRRFRRIAQRITFRILLREANSVMRTMTRRYSLHAAGNGGMAVDVVDHDMGSIVRTAANLSGGETFMVSLALALGLSRMGGQYLNVDTLFLDEGFGTLDEDALNKAIYALETLQRKSGKLIGLISHVKMIKERVALQVIVTPIPGTGRSDLEGPGITKLAS